MTTATFAARVDLRQIAPRERHPLVFANFDMLRIGEAIELLNDHDPHPLRSQFEDRAGGQFDWSTLEAGPTLWRVQIARKAAGTAKARQDSCCSGGACCG
jgi:uncharacterized protein (DUF2249 family)